MGWSLRPEALSLDPEMYRWLDIAHGRSCREILFALGHEGGIRVQDRVQEGLVVPAINVVGRIHPFASSFGRPAHDLLPGVQQVLAAPMDLIVRQIGRASCRERV